MVYFVTKTKHKVMQDQTCLLKALAITWKFVKLKNNKNPVTFAQHEMCKIFH